MTHRTSKTGRVSTRGVFRSDLRRKYRYSQELEIRIRSQGRYLGRVSTYQAPCKIDNGGDNH
jgi:hypothetical protein